MKKVLPQKKVIECCEKCGGEIERLEALQSVDGTEEKVFTAFKQCSKCKTHYGVVNGSEYK